MPNISLLQLTSHPEFQETYQFNSIPNTADMLKQLTNAPDLATDIILLNVGKHDVLTFHWMGEYKEAVLFAVQVDW